jgi:hypothetical protein
MAPAVSLYRPAAVLVPIGGEPVTAMYGPLAGGFITNPRTAQDQNVPFIEVLYVDSSGAPAADEVTGTTVAVQAGQTYFIPAQSVGVSVNAKTAGHKFSGIVIQPPTPFPPVPQPGTFPPSGPTTLTEIIPAYLYEQYADDDALQVFFAAYNGAAQSFVDWFVNTPLAVYTSPAIFGPLLDWVAQGLYGMPRPVLSSGRNKDVGPVNTYPPNTLGPNVRKTIGPSDVTATSDDVFKRCITWNFYKGDGNQFNAKWLKRRCMRFLTGVNGSAPNIDQTYIISVTFGDGIISIRINVGTRSILGGAFPNLFGCNRLTPNALTTRFNPAPVQYPLEGVLKEAIESGVLQTPFQYSVSVAVAG